MMVPWPAPLAMHMASHCQQGWQWHRIKNKGTALA